MRIIVGISGASGSIYGHTLLRRLRRNSGIEIHLVLTRSAERTAHLEMGASAADFRSLAHFNYSLEDVGSRLASGSFVTAGMVIAPCSIHSMSSIGAGLSSNLLLRAADVCLKERRRLILMVRETPLHVGHLRTMVQLTEMGAIIAPPVPGFYQHPESVQDIVDHSVERVMDLMGVADPDARRWNGRTAEAAEPTPTRASQTRSEQP